MVSQSGTAAMNESKVDKNDDYYSTINRVQGIGNKPAGVDVLK